MLGASRHVTQVATCPPSCRGKTGWLVLWTQDLGRHGCLHHVTCVLHRMAMRLHACMQHHHRTVACTGCRHPRCWPLPLLPLPLALGPVALLALAAVALTAGPRHCPCCWPGPSLLLPSPLALTALVPAAGPALRAPTIVPYAPPPSRPTCHHHRTPRVTTIAPHVP